MRQKEAKLIRYSELYKNKCHSWKEREILLYITLFVFANVKVECHDVGPSNNRTLSPLWQALKNIYPTTVAY